MSQEYFRQLSSYRVACKQWSIILSVAILLVGASVRLTGPILLWAATPLVLLGLAEAGYAARQAGFAEETTGNMAGAPVAQSSAPARFVTVVRQYFAAVGSASIWPFYLILWSIFAVSAVNISSQSSKSAAAVAATASTPLATSPTGPPLPGYPAGMIPRYPNGAPYPATARPAFPGAAAQPRTPFPGGTRPPTPVNFGPKPPVRFPATPPAAPAGNPPSGIPSATPGPR